MNNDDKPELLTTKQVQFVNAWNGNRTEAARLAGYSKPEIASAKLMRIPAVENALQQKQRAMLQESGRRLGKELAFTRADVLNRLWELANTSAGATNYSISSQVRAATALAEMLEPKIDKGDLEGKTVEEVEFLVVHGYLPVLEPAGPENQLSAAPLDSELILAPTEPVNQTEQPPQATERSATTPTDDPPPAP